MVNAMIWLLKALSRGAVGAAASIITVQIICNYQALDDLLYNNADVHMYN